MAKKSLITKKALITGITGQDGSYLAEFLLDKGYEVHGIVRRSSTVNTHRINHLYDDPELLDKRFFLHFGDMTDMASLKQIIAKVEPDEIYNLAAQSHVRVSFEIPEITSTVDALGTLKLLEAIRISGLTQKTKLYQASTSELYGNAEESPQSETTPFNPQSPYAIAKQYAFHIIKNYREAYGLFACNGILFNHESERRGITFVTRKISIGLSKIKLGEQDVLELGNIDAKRDWGHAEDYVRAMWLMLQQPEPEDFVIATGESHSVREFIMAAAAELGMRIAWKGEGVDEVGINLDTQKAIIRINPKYYRPTEVYHLLGDPSKAREKLGWHNEVSFKQLVSRMVRSDYERLKKGEYLV